MEFLKILYTVTLKQKGPNKRNSLKDGPLFKTDFSPAFLTKNRKKMKKKSERFKNRRSWNAKQIDKDGQRDCK
jgi:hypothetical protein